MEVHVLNALGDNYIYIFCRNGKEAVVVDPGQAQTVLDFLSSNDLSLTGILLTHHHFDHTGGVKKLIRQTGCGIIEPTGPITAIPTPGHTKDSVCYLIDNGAGPDILFTGDTLFIGGCGRPMECGSEILWQSLQKLSALDDDTLVYTGHNYTQENYQFALSILPRDPAIERALTDFPNKNNPALSTMGFEKRTNIFLRAGEKEVKEALNIPTASDEQTFAELRKRKNKF
jgi:hydroxyacylglutathione hydrolase